MIASGFFGQKSREILALEIMKDSIARFGTGYANEKPKLGGTGAPPIDKPKPKNIMITREEDLNTDPITGRVAGGLAGKTVAENLDPTSEDAYWRENHRRQEWGDNEQDFDRDYLPAYRAGYMGRASHDTSWDETETKLENDWERSKGESRLPWKQAKPAVQAGWDRVEHAHRKTSATIPARKLSPV